jgi:hypothetical protein
MGNRQIVLVSTAGFSVLNTGIFWGEAKTKRLFSQCGAQINFADLTPYLTSLFLLFKNCVYVSLKSKLYSISIRKY